MLPRGWKGRIAKSMIYVELVWKKVSKNIFTALEMVEKVRLHVYSLRTWLCMSPHLVIGLKAMSMVCWTVDHNEDIVCLSQPSSLVAH
jgi:hypothetical protein